MYRKWILLTLFCLCLCFENANLIGCLQYKFTVYLTRECRGKGAIDSRWVRGLSQSPLLDQKHLQLLFSKPFTPKSIHIDAKDFLASFQFIDDSRAHKIIAPPHAVVTSSVSFIQQNHFAKLAQALDAFLWSHARFSFASVPWFQINCSNVV